MAVSAVRAEAYRLAFGDLSMEIDGGFRTPVVLPDWMIRARIDAGEHWRTVWRAIACHRSQLPNYAHLTALSETEQRRLWHVSDYARAFSTVNSGPALEDDLFAGLRPSVLELHRAA